MGKMKIEYRAINAVELNDLMVGEVFEVPTSKCLFIKTEDRDGMFNVFNFTNNQTTIINLSTLVTPRKATLVIE